jgi:hypothetical protein
MAAPYMDPWAPVAVVSPQFCAPRTMPLTVTKMAMSFSGGDFTVTGADCAVGAEGRGRLLQRRQTPRAPRRRRTAHSHHAAEGNNKRSRSFYLLFVLWSPCMRVPKDE